MPCVLCGAAEGLVFIASRSASSGGFCVSVKFMKGTNEMDSSSLLSLRNELEKAIETRPGDSVLLEILGSLVDAAGDLLAEDALKVAISLSVDIEAGAHPADACLVLYLRSNAWSHLQVVRHDAGNMYSWEQPELLWQIYWLRAAVQHEGFEKLHAGRRSQIFCNLGNALSSLGRVIEAIGEWRTSLRELPTHGMARGNLGMGLFQYALAVPDSGHAYWLFRGAQDHLVEAINGGTGKDGSTYPEALEAFARNLGDTEHYLGRYGDCDEDGPSAPPKSRGKKERQYRDWCAHNTLYLNPLNDFEPGHFVTEDALRLPSHEIGGAGITYRAFFNQLKQEYVYARWCLYEGVTARSVHFADKQTHLESNCDLALYSMGLEQVKTAFRCAYSLLDKVAYFINDYWDVGWPRKKVSFREVWYKEKKKGVPVTPLRPVFEASRNPYLRGLFWLSKDIYLDSLQDVADPSAKESDALRNHMEHKFMKVVDTLLTEGASSEMFNDHLGHVVERNELVSRSEHVLKMSRAALIYLTLAMRHEQRFGPSAIGPKRPAVPVDLGLYRDSFKR